MLTVELKTEVVFLAQNKLHHYIKITFVCLSVCPSVTEGHQKRFDLEPSYAISLATEHLKLKGGDLCERQPWYRLQAETTA